MLFITSAAVIAASADRIPLAVGWFLAAVVLGVVAVAAAATPGSTARRYAQRGRNIMLTDPEQALRDFSRAAQLDPQDDSFALARVQVLRRLERRPGDGGHSGGPKPLHDGRAIGRWGKVRGGQQTAPGVEHPVLTSRRSWGAIGPSHVGSGSRGRSSGPKSWL